MSMSKKMSHFCQLRFLQGAGLLCGLAIFLLANQRPSDPTGVIGDHSGRLVSWHPGKQQLNSEIVAVIMAGCSAGQGLRPITAKIGHSGHLSC